MILQPSGQPSGSADQRISGSADQRISGPADQRISGSADQRISGSADQRISGSVDQRISGSADQRISGPADQRTSGSADQRISGPNQEIHGSARPRILQSAIFLYLSTAFHTRACLSLIAGSFPKKLYLWQVSACHQQHHDYVMYVLLAAILHFVWRLGSVVWGTLSYPERCHSELDVRPEVIIPSSSLSGLAISLRRATLEWCGGLQFSPQHKCMCMHAISNIMIMSYMSFWQQSFTLSDVWDLRNLILLWALSFRVGCAAWGHFVVRFVNFTKAGNPRVVRRAPILTATQIHVHACHQQHHDYVMYVLLAAIFHIVWRLGFGEPYPTLSVVIQSWMRGLRSFRCPVWEFHQGGQPSSGAEGSNSHRNTNACACMPSATSWLCLVCLSGSNPPHCLTFGIWGTLSYSERCHSELDVRPEVIIPSSSLSGLAISLRRATLEWCGGLQFSPQHKCMCMHAISNIMIMSCMSFWQQSSTLSDVWDLLFEEPYPTLSVVIQSWMCGLRSSSLPLRCLVW